MNTSSTVGAKPAVAVIAPVAIDAQMLGPGLRYWEFANQISRQQPVTLLTPNTDPPKSAAFNVQPYQERGALAHVLGSHPVVIIQGYPLFFIPTLRDLLRAADNAVVVDLYTPLNLEGLEIIKNGPAAHKWNGININVLLEQMQLGDFFICASERQRDYYLGMLAAAGRINPHTYHGDPTGRRLIDVVPFGMPTSAPVAGDWRFKGVHPGIAATDKLLLWFGGMWNWLDSVSVIHAFAAIAPAHPETKLLFVTKPPAAEEPAGEEYRQSLALAESTGLLDKRIFFSGPIPPDSRGSLLCEADIGLSYQKEHLETRFAYRTRIIDYIWAGLPMVVGQGDELGDMAAARGLGIAVPPGDTAALAHAMNVLLSEPAARATRAAAFAAARANLTWDNAAQPLLSFCSCPLQANDKPHISGDRLTAVMGELQARVHRLEEDTHMSHAEIEKLNAELATFARHNASLLTLINAYEKGRFMRLMNRVSSLLRRKNSTGVKP